ncbi:MAG: hypothetical protein KatS3mg083_587 [Candidatus Dojkabacteria bacterium]|nr:MAG: hypothetical protein KatS3mg083_587 [Candidatus Dojkabacteria bacterium]GIW61222.1 MAG: hypothetical protein KatS3mg089_0074 [Patescibacteria group bacterium]
MLELSRSINNEKIKTYYDNESNQHPVNTLNHWIKAFNNSRRSAVSVDALSFSNNYDPNHAIEEFYYHLSSRQGLELIIPRYPNRRELLSFSMLDDSDLLIRGGSAHGVFFVQGNTQEVRSGKIKKSKIDLAVKQFSDPQKAMREFLITLVVRQRMIDFVKYLKNYGEVSINGCLFTPIQPIALFVDKKQGYLLTRANRMITSLDQEPWSQYWSATDEDKKRIQNRFAKISMLLANLHSNGIFHGDAQIKNFVVSPHGFVGAIDWEAAYLAPVDFVEIPSDILIGKATSDLQIFYKSISEDDKNLSRLELITGSQEQKWELFSNLVIDPYMTQWLEISEKHNSHGSKSEALFNWENFYEQLQKELKRYITAK